MNKTADWTLLVGRLALIALYATSAIGKFGALDQTASMIGSKGLPFPAALALVAGGAAVGPQGVASLHHISAAFAPARRGPDRRVDKAHRLRFVTRAADRFKVRHVLCCCVSRVTLRFCFIVRPRGLFGRRGCRAGFPALLPRFFRTSVFTAVRRPPNTRTSR